MISIGFALTGLVLAATAVFMVWTFGEGLGVTPHQQTAYAVAHVALHVFGMLVAFSIGIFLIDKSIPWAVLVAVLALGVGGYGISNIAGFSAKNRISVSDAVRENDKRAIQRYEAARSDLTAKRDWAGGQSMSFEHSRYERLQFKGKEREYQKMLEELRMPQVTAATVNADAGASVISRMFGSSDENWQVRFAVIIAVLMFIGEFFSFILCGRMWPTTATVAALARRKEAVEPPKSGNTGSGGGKDDNVIPLKPAEPSTPAIRAETATIAAPTTPVVEHPVPATPQRSVAPVASAPWSEDRVDAFLKQRPLMANPPTWRQLGADIGWDYTTLHKRAKRLAGESKGKRVLGQHRQQHRHQEGNRAYA